MLKNAVTRGQLSDAEVIDRFLQAKVEASRGKLVTSKQLWDAFLAFGRTSKLPLCPETIFYRLLRTKIRQQFGIGHSHDRIPGESENRRYYRHLSFKSPALVVVQLSDSVVTRIHVHANN